MKNLIQPFQGQSKALAFGLNWHTILGEKLDALAVKLAKRERATHYTRGGSRSTAVGLLSLARSDRKKYARTPLYSAAAAFARACPHGAVAIRWNVPGGVWIAGAFDGVVLTGTDVIYDSSQEAQQALDDLHSQHAELVVFGDGTDKPITHEALIKEVNEAIALKQAAGALARIPLPLWVMLAMIVGWSLVQEGWRWYEVREAEKRRAATQVVQVDPVKAWQEVLGKWSKTVSVHSTEDFKSILISVSDAPVFAGRWELTEITCNPIERNCTAQYQRTHLGDNLALISALPKNWKVTFLDLHNAVAAWAIPSIEKHALALTELPTDDSLKTSWSTAYQRLAPALTDISLSSPQSAEVNPPVQSRPDGRVEVIPFPAGGRISMPVVRDLMLTGPLRSLYALDFPASASLMRLHVRRMPTSQADVSNSVLVATLTGKIYAK